jgi:hypothetical protein
MRTHLLIVVNLMLLVSRTAEARIGRRYNQVRQKFIHNAMMSAENALDILQYWGCESSSSTCIIKGMATFRRGIGGSITSMARPIN